jgi:hypothetical protein
MEGRVDNLTALNLGCALDKSCHRLQHLPIGLGVVSFGISLILPALRETHEHWGFECNRLWVLKKSP